jgi:predicted nuclease of predicted toxin-antitoxin system
MRILIDECVPRRILNHFTEHDAHTVPEMGWAGKKDSELLQVMGSDGIRVLVTVDQNIRHQQNLDKLGVGIIVLVAASNRLADLIPLIPSALAAIESLQPGDIIDITL